MPTRPSSRAPRPPPLAIALGSFDGVHLGHQQIIRRTREMADELGAAVGVLTYDPLPAQLIYPDFTYILTPLSEKKALLTELGVECICLLRFDAAMRDTEPGDFIRHHIVDALAPSAVVVGHDHRFGRRGLGDADLLRLTLEPLGVRVEVIPEVLLHDVPVRSTTIREHLLLGHVRLAAELLGRPYAMSGTVVSGTGTGRRLGFPTLNLRPFERETLVPADGVYVGLVDTDRRHSPAVLNIGHRPTFGGETRTIEAHLLDTKLDRSPDTAAFRLVDRIRPERRFENPQALAEQIARDVACAREILAGRNLDSRMPSNNL